MKYITCRTVEGLYYKSEKPSGAIKSETSSDLATQEVLSRDNILARQGNNQLEFGSQFFVGRQGLLQEEGNDRK